MSISSLGGGREGQLIELHSLANATINDTSTIRLSKSMPFSMTAGSTIQLRLRSGVWHELSRSE